MSYNVLTGLDEQFMREHHVMDPPAFLLPFIEKGLLLRASIVRVKNPKLLEDCQTLNLALRSRDDYKFIAKLLRMHDWLPQSRIQWDAGQSGSISCMHRDDRGLWASCRFYPLDADLE